MSTDALTPALRAGRPVAPRVAAAAALARREGPLLSTVAVMALVVVVVTPLAQLSQDGWLTLVSGREIVHHGLFARDSLTILNHGERWIDQQWLAQVLFYGLATVGGLKLVMLAHFTLLIGTFVLGAAIARRRGAGSLSVAWIGTLTIILSAWGWPLRSQNFAYPLFVAVLGLLLLDRDGPGRRAFMTVPLLVVWANLHGSVLVGTALVCLYAACCSAGALRSRLARGAVLLRSGALAAGAVGSIFASPYGPSLVHYYRSILGNHDMRMIAEWRPATDFSTGWMFLAFVAIVALLTLAFRKRLRPFELLVLLATAAAGMQAVRNAIWFDYAVLVILPIGLEGTRFVRPRQANRKPTRLFVPLAVATLTVTAVYGLGRDSAWYEQQWSSAAVARVSAQAHAPGGATIWATERYADWLLWKDPALRGHVAYDARFELVRHGDFRRIAFFTATHGRDWHAVVDPYDVVVLSTANNGKQIDVLRATGRRPTLYRDRFVTVLGSAADS